MQNSKTCNKITYYATLMVNIWCKYSGMHRNDLLTYLQKLHLYKLE